MRLIVVGPLPPPHHGVTISTGLVLGNVLCLLRDPERRQRLGEAPVAAPAQAEA